MEILFVTPLYGNYKGGVEIHIKNIAERLANRGYNVIVYATDPYNDQPTKEEINGVKVKRFRSYAPNEAYYIPSLSMLKALKDVNVDLVHAHSVRALPLLYACLAKHYRLLLTTHMHQEASTLFRNLLLKLYIRLFRHQFTKADMIIAVSEFEKNIVRSMLRVDADKIAVIPNGINDDVFNVKLKSDGFNLLCVGRLEKYKNFDKVIKALNILHTKYRYNDAKLTIVGKGPYKSELINMVKDLDLSNHVTFKSDLSRKELLDEYAKSKIFLLPSEYEAYGIAAVEAIAMKIPTIVNINTALREFVDRGSAIGIEPPITSDKIANAIIDAMNFKPNDVRDKIITWNEVVDRLEYIYAEKRIERI